MSAFATIFAQVSASMPDSLTEAVADSIDTVSEAVATVVNDIPAIETVAETPAVKDLSVWELCLEGGWVMIPLALLAVIAIYVFIERAIVIRRAAQEDVTFMQRIRDYIHEGEIESAQNLCRQTNTPYSRLIDKGISRIGRPMNDVLVAIENTGNIEVANLGKGLPWLATTAAGAPMIGFLGTVIGMVQAFYNLASAGSGANIDVLAGGIYEALVTTVAGLMVGILALFAYNYLVAKINGVMNDLEGKTMEFMDLLNEPAK
ncbi:MAG: MotA/TolQ/ExbB proton channel family protein [Paramuribaculum sp.]|nr:MotA/TolQ/ExbB proton channel family protein [Paramuribaculum sp.]MDE6651826.1 MotA/TolQ/ExbB proton channel family protein [Paramuribaculum sp.]